MTAPDSETYSSPLATLLYPIGVAYSLAYLKEGKKTEKIKYAIAYTCLLVCIFLSTTAHCAQSEQEFN